MKLQTFLICDDVRNEIGNKHSLIGVYEDRILFNVPPEKQNSWPKQMKIGIYAKVLFDDENPKSFAFKMQYNTRDELLGEGIINKRDSGTGKNKFVAAVVLNNFVFDKPGTIFFTFDFFDEHKNKIGSLSPESGLEVGEFVFTKRKIQ